MNPDNLPSNTEYAYAHFAQPHPWLATQTGFAIKPIRPIVKQNLKISIPDYDAHPDDQIPSDLPTPIKRGRGRPKTPKPQK
jgi:hypothetical protein